MNAWWLLNLWVVLSYWSKSLTISRLGKAHCCLSNVLWPWAAFSFCLYLKELPPNSQCRTLTMIGQPLLRWVSVVLAVCGAGVQLHFNVYKWPGSSLPYQAGLIAMLFLYFHDNTSLASRSLGIPGQWYLHIICVFNLFSLLSLYFLLFHAFVQDSFCLGELQVTIIYPMSLVSYWWYLPMCLIYYRYRFYGICGRKVVWFLFLHSVFGICHKFLYRYVIIIACPPQTMDL